MQTKDQIERILNDLSVFEVNTSDAIKHIHARISATEQQLLSAALNSETITRLKRLLNPNIQLKAQRTITSKEPADYKEIHYLREQNDILVRKCHILEQQAARQDQQA